MLGHPVLYYITGRTAFSGDESTRRHRLLEKISEAAHAGLDYIQLREKNLPARELELLAQEVVAVLNRLRTENRELRTKLLINSRTDVALAAGADGVHLRSEDISPKHVRDVWSRSREVADANESRGREPIIAVSCHTPEEVNQAAVNGADFAVFAPVFEKANVTPAGLDRLREACRATIPVLALGGITLENAQSCLQAGAGGIAAIRLFQENEIPKVVRRVRQNS